MPQWTSTLRATVLAIAGCTNSGKTTLATKLVEELKAKGCSVTLITQDDYYKEKEEVATIPNLDDPSIVFYDYDSVQSLKVDYMQSAILQSAAVSDFVVVEGIMITDIPSIFELIDQTVFFVLDKEVCTHRRHLRIYDPPDEIGIVEEVVMDAGFYRGTNADQDNRFTDKEKKLLRQMKFEPVLDTKVDLSKVNMEVIKPWITCKLNDILGIEDDVVIEYVFTQLEDQKNINPKVMQINLTGFLNARRSREFMAELWQMFVEAQTSPDGIPKAIVEKKMKELKAAATATSNSASKSGGDNSNRARDDDWQHRYQSLTGGRYGKMETSSNAEVDKPRDRSPLVRRDRDDRSNRDRRSSRDRIRDRSRDRDRSRERYRPRRSRTRSPPLPPRRRFTETKEQKESDGEPVEEKASDAERASNGSEVHKKKKKRKHRHHSSEPDNGEDSGAERKKLKKHKKEKKKKHKKDRG